MAIVCYFLSHKTCAEHCTREVDECPVEQGCPKNAIKEVVLAGGDRVPKIMIEKCDNCGACYNLCRVGAVEKYVYENEQDRENYRPAKVLKMLFGTEVNAR